MCCSHPTTGAPPAKGEDGKPHENDIHTKPPKPTHPRQAPSTTRHAGRCKTPSTPLASHNLTSVLVPPCTPNTSVKVKGKRVPGRGKGLHSTCNLVPLPFTQNMTLQIALGSRKLGATKRWAKRSLLTKCWWSKAYNEV